MAARWVVIADAARARIFEQETATSPLHELTDLVHGESALHAGDLGTGGRGGTVSIGSQKSLRQSDPQLTPSETHAERFAKEVTEHLNRSRAQGSFDSLVLIAEPRFLGRLRANVDSATEKLLAFTVDKNLVESSVNTIDKELRSHTESIR